MKQENVTLVSEQGKRLDVYGSNSRRSNEFYDQPPILLSETAIFSSSIKVNVCITVDVTLSYFENNSGCPFKRT
jgi:hypothetical protein